MSPKPNTVTSQNKPQGQESSIRREKMNCAENIHTDFVNIQTTSSGARELLQDRDYGVEGTTLPNGTSPSLLYKESERLKTFEEWPVTFLTPTQMASAGFYFLKDEDIVRCAFCNVEVGHWEPGDDPMKDHKRWSPCCKFVRSLPENGNVPLEGREEASSSCVKNGYDTCGVYGILPNSEEGSICLDKLKIQSRRPPSFPNYAILDSRLRSFQSWPISLKLKPQILSEAGFFYTGKGDQTLCFNCGGGLKDWEETDDPWVEHARWFSKCSYVILMKGQSFIDEVSGEKYRQELERSASASTGDLDKVIPEDFDKKQEKVQSVKENHPISKEEMRSPTSSSTKDQPSVDDARLCKICYAAEIGVAFLPCGHVAACPQCAIPVTKCVTCRKPISAVIRVYIS